MKTTFRLTNLLAIVLLIFVFACSSDDSDDEGNTGINTQNLVTTTDENPTNGQSVGTVQAVGRGTLSFSITSQTPSGALSINPSTGELTVANASLFDFETNPVISAEVSILDSNNTASATVAINLNNLDDIASFLSTSEATYTAAADGDWIEVTENEYINLADKLNDVSKSGTTDAEYNSTQNGGYGFGNITRAISTTTAIIPNNGYVFAFKYQTRNASTDITNTKVKQSSTANNNGFIDLGTALPIHTTSSNYSNIYFVLKGSNTPVTVTGYLAVYNTANISISDDSRTIYYELGDEQQLTRTGNSCPYYQGLNTTQKQW